MITVGPPLQPPPASGGTAAAPVRGAAPLPIPVQLIEPANLPDSLSANSPLAAVVEPGGQGGVASDLVVVRTSQGIISFLSPVTLAAGTSVTLQLATVAGRTQLMLIPPRNAAPEAPTDEATPNRATVPTAAKLSLDPLVPGRVLTATVVRTASAPRPGPTASTVAATAVDQAGAAESAAIDDIGAEAGARAGTPSAQPSSTAPAAAGAGAPINTGTATSSPVSPPAGPGATTASRAASGTAAAVPSNVPAAAGTAAAEPAAAPAIPAFAGMAQGEQLTVKIVSVAMPAATASSPVAASPPQQLTAAPASAGPSSAPATAGAPPATPVAAGPSLPAAAQVATPVVAAAQPAVAAQPAGTIASNTTAPASSPATPANPVPATPAAPPAPIAAAAPAAASAALAAAPPPPSGAIPAASPAAAPIEIMTSVVGSDAAGQPIVAAGSVLLVLDGAAPPVGSAVVLAVQRSATAPVAAGATIAPAVAPFAALAEEAARQPGPLQQAVAAVMPRPGPALAAQLAMYLQAARRGSATAWLGGNAVDQLEKLGKGRTAQRLGNALAELATASTGDRGSSWLSLTLPLAHAGVIQPIQLYVQRRDDDDEKKERPDAQQGRRFLIDFTLTRLGGIQLDGLTRGDRLDLIVRTARPVDGALRTDIDRLFADVTSARGIVGALIFQVAPPVTPIRQTPSQASATGIFA